MKLKYVLVVIFFIFLSGTAYFLADRYVATEKIKPKIGDVVESIYGLGTVTADQTYRFRAGVNSIVGKVFVKEGDLVQPRDPLSEVG